MERPQLNGRSTPSIMTTANTTLTIAFLGLQPRDRKLFESFLGILEGRSHNRLHIAQPGERVDVLIVDSDVHPDPSAGDLAGANRVVFYGEGVPAGGDQQPSLPKPVRFWELQAVLAAATDHQDTPGEAASGNPPAGPRRLHQLLEEVDHDTPLVITFDQWTIVTDPARGNFYFPEWLSELAPLCQAEGDRLSLRPATDAEVRDAATSLRTGPLLRLWWEAAFIGSQGALPAGVGPDTPVSLSRWPDLGVLGYRAFYAALCAQIARRTLSPNEIARRTGVDSGDVAAFLSASAFCGYLQTSSAPPGATRPAPAPAPQTGLISRIKKRLGLGLPLAS